MVEDPDTSRTDRRVEFHVSTSDFGPPTDRGLSSVKASVFLVGIVVLLAAVMLLFLFARWLLGAPGQDLLAMGSAPHRRWRVQRWIEQ